MRTGRSQEDQKVQEHQEVNRIHQLQTIAATSHRNKQFL